VTHYTLHPGPSAAGMRKRIWALHDGCDLKLSGEAMGRILDTAAGRVDPERFIFLEVIEEKNPRKFLDINVYDAGLRLRELGGILDKVCRGFSIPPEGFQKHFERIQNGILGHVGGGVDRTDRGSVTIYFEPQGP
jgi:hypothetical protein